MHCNLFFPLTSDIELMSPLPHTRLFSNLRHNLSRSPVFIFFRKNDRKFKRRHMTNEGIEDFFKFIILMRTARHFPSEVPQNTSQGSKTRRHCKVCLSRGASPSTCVPCNTPLCAVPCFQEYHTLKHY